MGVYEPLNKSDNSVTEVRLSSKINLVSSSNGVSVQTFRSGSTGETGSFWQALRMNFYMSGSVYSKTESRFNEESYHYSLCYLANQDNKKQHKNKFHDSGSVLSVSQLLFGEQIVADTFKLTDNSHPSGTVVITDDGYGNLYAPSCSISSSGNALSSSDNYIGNIFYEWGVINITETGSFSHTPSTSSVTLQNIVSHSNAFQITGSDLSTSVTFMVNAGSITGSDDTNLHYFTSASGHSQISESLLVTALSASRKLNNTFTNYLSSSVTVATNPVINITNDRKPNKPVNVNDNLPPITASLHSNIGFTVAGFGGGVSSINYTDILADDFSLYFDSLQTTYIHEYNAKVMGSKLNGSNNPTAATGSRRGGYRYKNNLTASNWAPYITAVGLYDKPGGRPVAVARLSQPIKKIKWSDLIFKIRIDG